MAEYNRLLKNPPPGPLVPMKPRRKGVYEQPGKSTASIVRHDDRCSGIRTAVELLGGMNLLVKDVEGEILIKPNCNTDDPYPRDTHPDTVRTIAELLIEAGHPPGKIVIGEISGRARGLPTRHTFENIGMKQVADDLGLQLSYFDEEPWVTVRPPESTAWPIGIKIPQRVYDAERVILTPILHSHSNAVFTISLKLAVGMIDAEGREWLHDGMDFMQKMVELNLAYTADLVIADATRMYTGRGSPFASVVEPGVIVAGGNRVAVDALCVALMKMNWVSRVSSSHVLGQEQFTIAESLGLGSPRSADMYLNSFNLTTDSNYRYIFTAICEELSGVITKLP
jgi:uncharacterized protein (DUF362 family)